jgi:hypothetical protein
MRPARVAAILMLSFLFGGSSAEVAVQAKRAIARHRAAAEVGSAGDLVAFEIHGERGELIARPRVLSAPGHPTELVLRDALHPGLVRLALHVATFRDPSGELAVEYAIDLPAAAVVAAGRVQVEAGVERALDLGDGALTARLLAMPVPSAAFDAFLEAERARRAVLDAS